jgi:hypothetical protein
MLECVRCGDEVCELHIDADLCLACQIERTREERAREVGGILTRKQWDLFCGAISIARTLTNSKIVDCKVANWPATMYEQWAVEVEAAREALIAINQREAA